MKCSKCGLEFSQSVFPIHYKNCNGVKKEENKKEMTKKEIIEELKVKGIEFDYRAKKDDLIDLLEG